MHEPRSSGGGTGEEAAAPPPPSASVRDHLANERTLLAWVRTALTIVGLGFVMGRLLVEEAGERDPFLTAASVVLVVLGGVASLLAARRFLRTQREIDTGDFRPASQLDIALAGGVAVAAVILAVSLLLGA
jgi:putative membrane protein